jgi:uncharacterized protein YecE (DUF72 family)
MPTLPLFDEPSRFDRQALARKLDKLAAEQIYMGGSSWKYEGWLGQIYTPERYFTRGRFSQKRFEEHCIQEYAETFPIVCGDFSFYQFPSEDFWKKLFSASPAHLKFAFKVPEEITRKTFSASPRYGERASQANPSFLNAELFESQFLAPLESFRERVALLIFEFGEFSKKAYPEPARFFEDLDGFLARLPRDWTYAVEVRNEDFLQPAYFDILHKHGVAHVFNAWNRMPPLHKQIAIAGAFTANFTVVRALLRAGRSYEQAVNLFAPYDRIKEENPKARAVMQDLIVRARKRREPAYLFINNRLEGNSPITIESIVKDID